MAQQQPKKGPRMTRIGHKAAMSHEETEHLEFEAELDASADKVFSAIERARGKMSESERKLADKNAAAILNSATESVERSRRRA